MAAIVRMSRNELLSIIEGIEKSGGDTARLRMFYDSLGINGAVTKSEFSDEDYIKQKREQSETQTGEGLTCSICNTPVDVLVSGVCEDCFGSWMLSCRKD